MVEWDELRSRARTLETELDAKLVSFAKMCNRKSSTVSSIEMEIDELLIELDSVTERMAIYAESTNNQSNANVAHTLTRHRDILQGNKILNNRKQRLKCYSYPLREKRGLRGTNRRQ